MEIKIISSNNLFDLYIDNEIYIDGELTTARCTKQELMTWIDCIIE